MKLLTPQVIYTLIFCLGIAIIFLTFSLRIKKGSNASKEILENYLKEDHAANFVTKKTLPPDLLLSPNFDTIPYSPASTCQSSFDLAKKLSLLPMARLDGYSNVELKCHFGINHLEKLFQYELHYLNYLKALTNYGVSLAEDHYIKESIVVLENCLQFGCDLNKCYLYLIKNYGIINDKENLILLKKHLEVQPPLGKEMIELALEETLQSLNNE